MPVHAQCARKQGHIKKLSVSNDNFFFIVIIIIYFEHGQDLSGTWLRHKNGKKKKTIQDFRPSRCQSWSMASLSLSQFVAVVLQRSSSMLVLVLVSAIDISLSPLALFLAHYLSSSNLDCSRARSFSVKLHIVLLLLFLKTGLTKFS